MKINSLSQAVISTCSSRGDDRGGYQVIKSKKKLTVFATILMMRLSRSCVTFCATGMGGWPLHCIVWCHYCGTLYLSSLNLTIFRMAAIEKVTM